MIKVVSSMGVPFGLRFRLLEYELYEYEYEYQLPAMWENKRAGTLPLGKK